MNEEQSNRNHIIEAVAAAYLAMARSGHRPEFFDEFIDPPAASDEELRAEALSYATAMVEQEIVSYRDSQLACAQVYAAEARNVLVLGPLRTTLRQSSDWEAQIRIAAALLEMAQREIKKLRTTGGHHE